MFAWCITNIFPSSKKPFVIFPNFANYEYTYVSYKVENTGNDTFSAVSYAKKANGNAGAYNEGIKWRLELSDGIMSWIRSGSNNAYSGCIQGGYHARF